jgi:hypothetical protein
MKEERLPPTKWISKDRYKSYTAYDSDFMKFESDTGKSPYEGKEYRVVKSKEKYLQVSQRHRKTEEVYTVTSLPSWEADVQKIVQTRRDEWAIEINIFKELSEKMASKLNDHFFRKDDNSKKNMFVIALLVRDLRSSATCSNV